MERRERLNLTRKALAEAVGMSRDTLAAVETGKSYRRLTLTRIERVLGDLEREAGIEPTSLLPVTASEPDHRRVEYRVEGLFGSSLAVEGPASMLHELEASVVRILKETQAGSAGA